MKMKNALKAMLKVAEIRVDGLLLEKRVNSLALRSCSVVPRIPAVAVECGIQTQYYLASPVCIPLLNVIYWKAFANFTLIVCVERHKLSRLQEIEKTNLPSLHRPQPSPSPDCTQGKEWS